MAKNFRKKDPLRQPLTKHEETIRELSDLLIKIQKPIRILDALKWGPEVQATFFKNGFKSMPKINPEYYLKNNPLPYDPQVKKEEFYSLERKIRNKLGQFSGVGQIMMRMSQEYREVLRLLLARGSDEFSEISQELYGSADEVLYTGSPTLNDLATMMTATLTNIHSKVIGEVDQKDYDSEQTVRILNERLNSYFGGDKQRVKISDGILADSSAGAEFIKIRRGARFSLREIRAFEVHEGWVHLGTTLNGLAQPICTFLSKGAPSSTQTQEGLATAMEVFTFSSYPGRLLRLIDRITAIYMAQQGADFIEVFKYFQSRGNNDVDSYACASRVFRGSSPTKGPFTKDLTYNRGFVFVYNYIRLAMQRGLLSHIPLLFLGKVALEDLPILADLVEEGIILPPKYIPVQFRDFAALSAWMSYTLFLAQLDLKQIAAEYKHILLG